MQTFVNQNLLQACQQRVYPTYTPLYRRLVKQALDAEVVPKLVATAGSSSRKLRVLDAACGFGDLAAAVTSTSTSTFISSGGATSSSEIRLNYTGFDFDPFVIEEARKASRYDLRQGDVAHGNRVFQDYLHQGNQKAHKLQAEEVEDNDNEGGPLAVVSCFGAHYMEEYALKKFLGHARDFLLDRKPKSASAGTSSSSSSSSSSPGAVHSGGLILLTLWSPAMREDCVLTKFLRAASPHLNLNVRHMKPYGRHFFPHHHKVNTAAAQKEVLEDILVQKLKVESARVTFTSSCSTTPSPTSSSPEEEEEGGQEKNQKVKMLTAECPVTFDELRTELFEHRTFGDISALLSAQDEETEKKAYECLEKVVASSSAGRATIRKEYSVVAVEL
eukprot:g1019.t1